MADQRDLRADERESIAADRDRIAATRDRTFARIQDGRLPSFEQLHREALARDQAARERDAAADERDRTAEAREAAARQRRQDGDEPDASADARDRAADLRDREADRRDRAADRRDRAADRRDRELIFGRLRHQDIHALIDELLKQADSRDLRAEQRDRRAEERERAAEREWAAGGNDGDRSDEVLRRQAVADRLLSGKDRDAAASDRAHLIEALRTVAAVLSGDRAEPAENSCGSARSDCISPLDEGASDRQRRPRDS
jgi:sulfite oxidase